MRAPNHVWFSACRGRYRVAPRQSCAPTSSTRSDLHYDCQKELPSLTPEKRFSTEIGLYFHMPVGTFGFKLGAERAAVIG
jgi:hypothetical protein